MGTTPNLGLRYPESTVLANTLHTQIKNLADDVDAKLPYLKFLGSTWWTGVGAENGGSFQNNGTDSYAYVPPTRNSIPAGTKVINVTCDIPARAGANAACYWYLCGQWETGETFIIQPGIRKHNGGDQFMAMGFVTTGWVYTSGHTQFKPYVAINVDTGGVGVQGGQGNFQTHFFA